MVEVRPSDVWIGIQSGTYPPFHCVDISGLIFEPRVESVDTTAHYSFVRRTLWLFRVGLIAIDGRLGCVMKPVGVEAHKE